MMKRLILILLTALSVCLAQAQDSLRISLLTCSQGDDISSAFGHSALRVTDPATGRDMVFNYGTFSFNEPGFILTFLKGDLIYSLSIDSFTGFKRSYIRAGRGIIEQPLNLTPEQRQDIYLFLLDNAKEENRYYLYDFLQDNCATRIRDIFDRGAYTSADSLTGLTYREEIKRMVGDKRWMMFGIDLLLGADIDREITLNETSFLPDRLSVNLAGYSNSSLGGMPLTDKVNVIVEPAPDRAGRAHRILSAATGPFSLFTVLLIVYLLIFMRTENKWKFMSIFSNILYTVLGLGGVILLLMWVATNHVWTQHNWNLLWMNPLMLILPLMRNGVAKNLAVDILSGIAVLTIAFAWLIPQSFHPAAVIITLLLAAVALSRRSIYRKY
ncbi:MAG TPA: DUF4105 domain-containing protein [Candidatus Coprenecus pullistercoris]|nr:DUF4105 domain-containing protein [Candidatus Coprenecus pullistercoris]